MASVDDDSLFARENGVSVVGRVMGPSVVLVSPCRSGKCLQIVSSLYFRSRWCGIPLVCRLSHAEKILRQYWNASNETAASDLPRLLATEDGIRQLHQEFESIKGGQRMPWTVAALPENIKKNRYGDLLAFDHSRVVLDKVPGDEHSDYINANYLDGYHGEKEYVATQGPLPGTVSDFWRMMWQLNATKIVMLANVVEHGQAGEWSVRVVRQFQFTGWPDLGVPNDTFPVISIVHQARSYGPESEAPLVVHCSAGVGRTGTVILMDSMIERAEAEGVVDFPKRLDHMRTLRPDVVEKKEQYVFAVRATSDVMNDPTVEPRLREVEAEYHRLDALLGANDLVPPKTSRDLLLKMKGKNDAMRILIDALIEKSGLDV